MQTDIAPFDPKSATEQELRQITDLYAAASPIDQPGSPVRPA